MTGTPTRIQLFDAQGYWLKRNPEEVDQVVLPLGLMYLASHARTVLGKDVLEFEIYNTVVDFDNDHEKIAEAIRKFDPHIIGIRGMTRYQTEFAMVAKAAKENSNALLVGGGPYVSSDAFLGMKDHPLDVAVFDEGEVTFAELIRNFREGKDFSEILGLAYRKSEDKSGPKKLSVVSDEPQLPADVVKNEKRPFMNGEELNAMDFPAYDLVDMDRYSTFLSYGYNHRRQGVVYTSRGCPYRCDFCHVLFGKKFRERSPESLFAEFKWLYDEHDVRDFYVVDDIFNLQKERAVEFFNKIIASHMGGNIRIYFVNGLRGDRVDKEFIDAAVAAGAVWLAYAVETASTRLQKEIRKLLKVDKVRAAIEYSESKEVAVIYWGMLGIQTETLEEAEATIDLLTSMPGSIIPMLFSNHPYPGTDAYEKLKKLDPDLDKKLEFSLETSYHDFYSLIKKDRGYYKIVNKWIKQTNSLENMRRATKRLMKIGHTPLDIERSYALLYRKLSKERVHELIAWAQDELAREALTREQAASAEEAISASSI